jgi:hypothetical protein
LHQRCSRRVSELSRCNLATLSFLGYTEASFLSRVDGFRSNLALAFNLRAMVLLFPTSSQARFPLALLIFYVTALLIPNALPHLFSLLVPSGFAFPLFSLRPPFSFLSKIQRACVCADARTSVRHEG